MDLPARLADILAQHLATTGEINRPVAVGTGHDQRERRTRRVLLPADQQRGCMPPKIAAPAKTPDTTAQLGSSRRSSST